MTLAHPHALWLLFLLAIPLLLARRRARRRQVVSNLYLWRDLARSDPAQITRRRLRRHVLAIVQMAVLAAMIASLARPNIATGASHVAFVFDVSASMSAYDGSVTRFDLARQRARAILDRLPSRARVRLIAAGPSTRDLGDYVVADPALARAMQSLATYAGSADLQAAIDLAAIAGVDGAAVHVFSDRPKPAPAGPDSGREAISWQTVGGAAPNLAIVKLAGRRLPLDPVNGQVLVDVRNYGARARDTQVEVAKDGEVIARRAVHVAAREGQTVIVPATPIGHVISARLLESDALDLDNRRWTVVPPLERVRVALVTRGNLFLESALAANPGISLQRVASERFDEREGTLAEPERAWDVVVCDTCSRIPRARGVLVITSGGPSLEPAILTVTRLDHPITASVDLGGLLARPVMSPIPADTSDIVVRAGGLPGVVASERDGQRMVEFRLDVSASSLTLSPAFPLLVANAVDWLAERNENPLEVVSGEPVRWILSARPTVDSFSILGPDGRPRRAQLLDGRLTVVETDLPGVYRVLTPTSEQVFVVNPAVDTESDLMPGGTSVTPSGSTAVPQLVPDQTAMAPLFLGVALLFFAAEWWYRPRGRASWRLLTVACLGLSAAGLGLAPHEGPVDAVVALDRSASMPPRAQERGVARVNGMASTMHRGDRLGVVVFGADAQLETRLSEHLNLSGIASTVVDTGTNIEKGLRLAHAALPRRGTRRILLISDGRETSGQAEKEATRAAADGVRIDVALPDVQGARRELRATRVVAPSEARVGEPFPISVEIEGEAGARSQVVLSRDDVRFGVRDVLVSTAGSATAAFSDRHQQPGFHTYRAIVKNADDDFSDQPTRDSGSGAVVSIAAASRVLYVASARDNLRGILAERGFRVTLVAPEAVPDLNGLDSYHAIVLDDVPAERLRTSQLSALAGYVEQRGGGLLLLGSPHSLDLAGYPAGPLGRILPVDLRPRAGQRAPSLGLVLIFDKSGSMADLADGTPKIELARQAVMKVLDVLPSTDSLGVMAFDAAPVVVAPLAPGQNARAIADRLRTIEPGGSTRIEPAAALAVRWLQDTARGSLSRRQILLVSDGRTSPEDANRLRTALANTNISLSAVAIGSNADRDLLRQLADSSGGRAYFPSNVSELPLIVAREAVRSKGGSIVEERVALRAVPHPILAGIDLQLLPSLGGYVVSAARSTATGILNSQLDDPILCVWRSGLGRVAVFTADLGSSWSAPLGQWRDDARLWAQAMRWVSRLTDEHTLRLTMTEGDDYETISVDAERRDGTLLNLADARAVVRGPAGETEEIALRASAPGRYETRMATTRPGPYVVAVAGEDRDDGTEHRVVAGFYWSANREHQFHDADRTQLERLAAITGGTLLGPAGSPFNEPHPREFADVSAWLIAVSLCLFVLDITAWWEVAVNRCTAWLRHEARSLGARRGA